MQASRWSDVPQRMMQIATLFTPALLSSLMLLWAAQPWLSRLSYRAGTGGDRDDAVADLAHSPPRSLVV